jgi:hypothetical protein
MDAALRDALRALAAGQPAMPIDSAVPLTAVSEAFERIRQLEARGTVVLTALDGR